MQMKVVYNVDEVKGFSPESANGAYMSKLLIDRDNMDSQHIILNEFTLKGGQQTYQGDHGAGYDEVYFFTKGKAVLYLENLETREYEAYDVRPGSYAFIKGGRGHYMKNQSDEDLVLLTFMPKNPPPGVNSVYDDRKKAWGKSFKLMNEA